MQKSLRDKAVSAFQDAPGDLESLTQDLEEIARILESHKSTVELTLRRCGDQKLIATVAMKNTTLEPRDTEVRRDFEIRNDDDGLIVAQNCYELGYDEAWPIHDQYMTRGEILRKVTAFVQEYMSPQEQERLGNTPEFQALDSPAAKLLQSRFQPVSFGIVQLTEAFEKLDDILNRHTGGDVRAGSRYIHSSHHAFYAGVTNPDASWDEKWDKMGWVIVTPEVNNCYSIDFNGYEFEEADTDNPEAEAEPQFQASWGSVTVSPADILGQAVSFVENGLGDDMSEELADELLALMETFPPEVKESPAPAVAAGPKPAPF